MKQSSVGFTLIEVLLALSIIAIALSALMQSNAQTIASTMRLQERSIRHWVAMQAITLIELDLLDITQHQPSTQVTSLFGQRWYWRAIVQPSVIKGVQRINVALSPNENGPFQTELTAFKAVSS